MTATTIEHAEYSDIALTPVTPQITEAEAPPLDEEREAALKTPPPARPAPGADVRYHELLSRYAELVFQIAGWEAIRREAERRSYANDAAAYEAEDTGRRASARRRQPEWADED